MRVGYSDVMVPPGLLVRVQVSRAGEQTRREMDGVIDTGAGLTVIPEDLRTELGQLPNGSIQGRGPVSREFLEYPTYYVSLHIADWDPFDLDVVALPRDNVLVGRDVLNRLVLRADGPAKVFDLTR